MADGGDGENPDNPFSFKKFVKSKSDDSEDRSEDESDAAPTLAFDLPDVSVGGPRRGRKENEPRREERDTNPFSFKKFLRSSNTSSNNGSSLKTLDLAHDLPDFVQDHYHEYGGSGSPRTRPRNPPVVEVPLPDFALDSALSASNSDSMQHQNSHAHIGAQGQSPDLGLESGNIGQGFNLNSARQSDVSDSGLPGLSSPGLPDFNSLSQDDPQPDIGHDDSHLRLCTANSSGGLPDFLPDSAISGAGARPKIPKQPIVENGFGLLDSADVNNCVSAQLQQLRQENEVLQRQMLEAETRAERDSHRLRELETENARLLGKEQEETDVLEHGIQVIEANLTQTTQRAVAAESLVVKLKEEIKSLKSKVGRLEADVVRLRGGESDPLRDKTQYAAEQLASAASTAEQQLKQLLTGVETLKMVSNLLMSAEKVSDFNPKGEPPGAAGGAGI